MLVDAGADTTSAVLVRDTPGGKVDFDGTPLTFTARSLYRKKLWGTDDILRSTSRRAAERTGRHPALAGAGGGYSCDVLDVARRCSVAHHQHCRTKAQGQDHIEIAEDDFTDAEATSEEAWGALGSTA